MLRTTLAGSLPKPIWLAEPEKLWALAAGAAWCARNWARAEGARHMRGITGFEHRRQPVISSQHFVLRLGRAALLWLALTLFGLIIGMAGYAATEGMSPVDAFVNAAMILSGMGPVTELKTAGGKLFAGFYAIFSGLIIVIATGFVLAPILHRVLHMFHVEEGRGRDD